MQSRARGSCMLHSELLSHPGASPPFGTAIFFPCSRFCLQSICAEFHSSKRWESVSHNQRSSGLKPFCGRRRPKKGENSGRWQLELYSNDSNCLDINGASCDPHADTGGKWEKDSSSRYVFSCLLHDVWVHSLIEGTVSRSPTHVSELKLQIWLL